MTKLGEALIEHANPSRSLLCEAEQRSLTGDTRKIFVSNIYIKTVDESHCSLGARFDRL